MSNIPRACTWADPLVERCRHAVGEDGLSAPSARADRALRRLVELRERLLQFEQGLPATSVTVDLARAHARQAEERTERAWRSALCRHVGAWRAHLRAAAALEQTALRVSDAECDAMQTAAERHRDAAAEHRDEVTRLASTSWPDTYPEPMSLDLLHQ